MPIIHDQNHEANVCDKLGVQVRPDARLFGIEIETGWLSEAKRSAFFRELEKRGIDNKCISKHDGTIGHRGETIPSEIVSVPLTSAEARDFTNTVGTVLERMADKGLVTSGCGVHIHMSEGIFGTHDLWRYAASICQTPSHMDLWVGMPKTQDEVNERRHASEKTHEFWDAVCLRGQTSHSIRKPYERASQISKTKDHTRAFIHGRNTPTYETRIFRTPKSRRVLTSYIDAVEALHSFSLGQFKGAEEHISQDAKAVDQAQVEEVRRTTLRPLRGFKYDNAITFYDELTGDQYSRQEVTALNGLAYPNADWANRLGLRLPTREEVALVSSTIAGLGAIGWNSGTLPLEVFTQYIMENEAQYKDLAKRLTYDKFSRYLIKDEIEPYVDNSAEPHLEFRRGCRVRIEGNRGVIYILTEKSIYKNNGGISQWKYHSEGQDPRYSSSDINVNALIHACKGALEPGGEV